MGECVLVTGGAGYVGAHACKALAKAGFQPVVFDNLATGWAEAVKWGPLVQADLMDRAAIDRALADYRPVAVMHFAALSLVGDSMKDPGLYWRVNVGGALNLAEACVAAGVKNFVFSSTCATYGDQDGVMLTEGTARESPAKLQYRPRGPPLVRRPPRPPHPPCQGDAVPEEWPRMPVLLVCLAATAVLPQQSGEHPLRRWRRC